MVDCACPIHCRHPRSQRAASMTPALNRRPLTHPNSLISQITLAQMLLSLWRESGPTQPRTAATIYSTPGRPESRCACRACGCGRYSHSSGHHDRHRLSAICATRHPHRRQNGEPPPQDKTGHDMLWQDARHGKISHLTSHPGQICNPAIGLAAPITCTPAPGNTTPC